MAGVEAPKINISQPSSVKSTAYPSANTSGTYKGKTISLPNPTVNKNDELAKAYSVAKAGNKGKALEILNDLYEAGYISQYQLAAEKFKDQIY
jgi:hypothetical protein